MYIDTIHFVADAPCANAIDLFSVLILLRKRDIYEGYSLFLNEDSAKPLVKLSCTTSWVGP